MVLIVSYLIMIILNNYLFPFVSKCNFNVITILSSNLLILDVYYKEKIANKIIKVLYIKEKKHI